MNDHARDATNDIFDGLKLNVPLFFRKRVFVERRIQRAIDAACKPLVEALECFAKGGWEHLRGRTWAGSAIEHARTALGAHKQGKVTSDYGKLH